MVGEYATGHVSNMQGEQLICVRWRCNAVSAAFAIFEQELDVLAGLVLQSFSRRQL